MSRAARDRRRARPAAPRIAWLAALGDSFRHERAWVTALLLAHALLVGWGIAGNSVTYDENFHLPSGVLIVARQDYDVSTVNPPLVKALCAIPALLAGARLPADSAIATRNQQQVGYAFMRANADHYHTVFAAARSVVLVLSLVLGVLVWRFARRLYGRHGGLVALGFYVLAPEALAHAGVVGMDLPTGLGFLATLYGWWGWTRSGRWRWWVIAALGFAFTVLTRFSAWSLWPILALVTLVTAWRRPLGHPRRVALGLVALLPVALLALQLGYLGRTSWTPIGGQVWSSEHFRSLAAAFPRLRLPLPDAYLRGLDRQTGESDSGSVPTFVFGHETRARIWWYFPLALAVKWPIAWLAALALRSAFARHAAPARRRDGAFLLLPAAAFLLAGMTLVQLNAGVRYMFPLVPILAVWLGGLVAVRPRGRGATATPRGLAPAAAALVALLAVETLGTAPWYLSFYNAAVGGPGGGDAIVNDSNADWGQGLIALRDELRRRGIQRVHLAYHGTVDPGLYGIDYVPYAGGAPDHQADWLAVSSYYFNGLGQRMVTRYGISPPIQLDFDGLRSRPPTARPAHCMYLYPVRASATSPKPR